MKHQVSAGRGMLRQGLLNIPWGCFCKVWEIKITGALSFLNPTLRSIALWNQQFKVEWMMNNVEDGGQSITVLFLPTTYHI